MAGFERIIGQENAISRLRAFGSLYSSREQAGEHILLVGQDGMGKRTIAHAYADAYNLKIKEVDAAKLERAGDITVVITSLAPREVLLVLRIASLRGNLKELLRTTLQEGKIELVVGHGPRAHIHPFQLSPFTCIATARKESDCPPELREAFSLTVPIERYSPSQLVALAALISSEVGVNLVPAVAKMIADAAVTPHQIEVMIKRLAKLGTGLITEENAVEILAATGVKAASSTSFALSEGLHQLTGTQFEHLITGLLDRMGFHTEMTKASGDGGIDIVAVLDKPLVGGRYLVQCKRFSAETLVGAPIVREFYGAVSADRKAIKGILITTSSFTDQAREFAHEVGIELIDMDLLSRLLAEHGM